MMTLVARLGLRSIEVARLELEDLDWRAGELVVRGKARRQDRLPLPAEVGEALVAYLSAGRNPSGARHLFLTVRAPRGPIRADLVGDVVERACRRAGLPQVGPHRLRHALAGELLRRGAGLVAISQVLAPPGPGHHRALCQGRPGLAAPGRPAVAGSAAMTALEQALADYLQLRRSLGHELAEAGRLLPRFVAYLDARGRSTVTIEAALGWAQTAGDGPRYDRRAAADDRGPGFARYLVGDRPCAPRSRRWA